MLKIGYKASAEQFGPRELLDFAIEAERQGFDSIWVSDHYQPFSHSQGHAPFSLSWLGALGERTARVQMGTSVLTPTFRYHPAVVAQAFATLAGLQPGRIVLGVGTGESMNEVPVIGIAWPDQRERFRRLSEAVKLIRTLWTRDFVEWDGEYYRVKGATLYDKPPGMIPIYVAATGPTAAKFAGRHADGFICTSGKGMELYSETLLPAVREGAEAERREYQAIEKTIELKVSFDRDRDKALADCRFWAPLALPAEDKQDVHNPKELEERAGKVEHAERRWMVSDDPEEHLEQLRPYLELGFTHLVFHSPAENQTAFLKLYAREILPRLKDRWG